MVSAIPENSPQVEPEKLQRFADSIAVPEISWRQAIRIVWGEDDPPKKAELRMFIKEKFGSVKEFRRIYSSTES